MRLLHTMLRVGDLQKSINFYTQILDMTLLRQSENMDYKYTLAFLGYGDESDTTALELTYNWDTSEYDLGNAYGHIAIETDDIYATNVNRKYCTRHGIVIKREERAGDTHGRELGKEKQHYSLDKIKAKTELNEILWIFFGVHTANAVRILILN